MGVKSRRGKKSGGKKTGGKKTGGKKTLIDNSTRADDDRLLRGIAYNYMG